MLRGSKITQGIVGLIYGFTCVATQARYFLSGIVGQTVLVRLGFAGVLCQD